MQYYYYVSSELFWIWVRIFFLVNGIELSLNFKRKLKWYPYYYIKKIDNNTLNSKKNQCDDFKNERIL